MRRDLCCAALYDFPAAKMGELAALTVHPQYQNFGDGRTPAQAHRGTRGQAA